MFNIRHRQEPAPGQSRTVRFDGKELGSEVSFFIVDNDPGGGPALHVHPYAETWIVGEGEVEFTIGNTRQRGSAGDIVVAAANIPHRFENVGTGRLKIICIHPRDAIQQVFVQAEAQAA